MDNKYNNSIVYIIICDTTNLFYIGSTIQGIKKREIKHKGDYKGYTGINPKFRKYRHSFKCLENDNYRFITLEDYNCDNKEDLLIREKEYMTYYSNKYQNRCINKATPIKKYNEEDLLYNNLNIIDI
tara:strand:- start:1380 stop:1760 length:381 start_codon:yes stop_codon:yes gene_type:complete